MKLLFTLVFLLCSFCLAAQNTLNETLKEQLVMDWERAKAYTQEYLDAMPADKYDFKAADSVRSFAEQMLHLSMANVLLGFHGTGFQNATVQKVLFSKTFGKSSGAQSKDSVVYYVNMTYDYIIGAIKKMDFSKGVEVITRDLPGGRRSVSRLAWVLKAFEHQTHHRGQCTIYLRQLGIKPPAERLWD
jgi:hypothetical protein